MEIHKQLKLTIKSHECQVYPIHQLNHLQSNSYQPTNVGVKVQVYQRLNQAIHRCHQESSVKKCDLCDKMFDNEADKKRHIRELHKNESQKKLNYTCDHCEKVYTRIYHLKVHIRKHKHKKNLKDCKYCGKGIPMNYFSTIFAIFQVFLVFMFSNMNV